MIKPTVGRVVWYYVSRVAAENEQPRAAMIVYVHSDHEVNLVTFNLSGEPKGRENVVLVQEGETRPEHKPFCEWMPYQKGQAAKTEQLEKQLFK